MATNHVHGIKVLFYFYYHYFVNLILFSINITFSRILNFLISNIFSLKYEADSIIMHRYHEKPLKRIIIQSHMKVLCYNTMTKTALYKEIKHNGLYITKTSTN